MARAPLVERFWRKVLIPLDAAGNRDPVPCWIWTGAKTRGVAVYGHIRDGAKHLKAHRVSLALHTGTMHDDLDAAHGPDCSKLCVNPFHLSWQPHRENMHEQIGRLGPIRQRKAA
jgi:hypothetical protein